MKLTDIKISAKLPIVMVALALAGVAVTGYIAFGEAEQALETAAMTKLEAIQESRISELEGYLKSIQEDVSATATSPAVVAAMTDFEESFDYLGDSAKETLHKAYITDNQIGRAHV